MGVCLRDRERASQSVSASIMHFTDIVCLASPARVPKRPVINTPVVSITVHDNDELLQHTLDKPITVQFRLVTTEERSKPICVFWNHSIL